MTPRQAWKLAYALGRNSPGRLAHYLGADLVRAVRYALTASDPLSYKRPGRVLAMQNWKRDPWRHTFNCRCSTRPMTFTVTLV